MDETEEQIAEMRAQLQAQQETLIQMQASLMQISPKETESETRHTKELEELRELVKAQRATIETLRARPPNSTQGNQSNLHGEQVENPPNAQDNQVINQSLQ